MVRPSTITSLLVCWQEEQSESVYPVRGFSGPWKGSLGCEVPLGYRIICLAALSRAGVGLLIDWLHKEIADAMSSHVPRTANNKRPMALARRCLSFQLSAICLV